MKPTQNHRNTILWLATSYAAALAVIVYPGLHEKFIASVILWNCFPPTLGFFLVLTALGHSKRQLIAAIIFAATATLVEVSFSIAWLVTPLDTDPHSVITQLVFVYAPFLSLLFATTLAVMGWLLTQRKAQPLPQ